MKILLLDTETTGLEDPRLVQVAYQHTANGMEYAEVNEIFKPAKPIEYGAMAMHHITNEMVADKDLFDGSPTQHEIVRLIGQGYIFVAHNAPFDIGVLRAEGIPEPRFWIDTKRCAMHLTQSDYHNLQYLRYSLGLHVGSRDYNEVVRAHDAAGDVTVLKALFEHLMKCCEGMVLKENPNATIEEQEKACLVMLINLSRQPVLVKIAKFGKYRGTAWSEIAGKDMDYLRWLRNNEGQKPEAEQDKDLLFTLDRYLTQ